MCMQCMAQALGATATAGSVRQYVFARHLSWLTPRRRQALTGLLLAGVLVGSSVGVDGSTQASGGPVAQHHVAAR
ncbi:MAG: hypothetical protein QOH62_2342 [Solirubrobacteraceae bacterium]|jgi:hypothetical protein|nr:hypothetical protein [Solirubrobacteraceae bacterium]